MKKITLLGALLVATTMQAQKTFYWPGQRVSELTDGQQYFIYNTAITTDGQDRTNLLYSNGSTLKTNKVKPSNFITSDPAYLFKTIKPEVVESTNHWYLNSLHGIVDIGGQTNNTEIRDLYITPWTTESVISKASDALSEPANLSTATDPSTTSTWTISKTNEANPNAGTSTNDGYAWNGNVGEWTTWNTAHPYAFYSIESKEFNEEASASLDLLYQANGPLAEAIAYMQENYGLVKDGNNYFSNKPESPNNEPGNSYENLLDGNDQTYFHTAWINSGSDPHYLRADLGTAQSSFRFITKRRMQNNNARPVKILIEGSNDDTQYTEITTLTAGDNGLPFEEKDYFYISKEITPSIPYRYIKFTVLNTSTNNIYFHYSEFYVIQNNDEVNKLCKLYENKSDVKTTSVTNESVIAAANDLNIFAYKKIGQELLDATESQHQANPAIGYYETAKRSALETAINSTTDANVLIDAYNKYKASLNAYVFTITSANAGAYSDGSSIYDDNSGTLKWKATNKYDKSMLWKFVDATTNTITSGTNYVVSNLKTTNNFWGADYITVNTNANGKYYFTLNGIVPENLDDINGGCIHAAAAGNTIVKWNANAPASTWTFEYVGESKNIDAVDEQKLAEFGELSELITACVPFEGKIGTGLNQFTSENFETALSAAKDVAAKDIYGNPNLDVTDAKNKLKAAKDVLTINQPEPGKYYRIKSVVKNKYVSSKPVADGRQSLIDDGTDPSTVYYLSEDNRLTNSIAINLDKDSRPAAMNLGTTFEFLINNNGYYMIKSNERNEPLYPHYDGGDLLSYDWRGGSFADKLEDAWILEEVTDEASLPKLTKTMTGEYATIAAPVSLVIPEGIKAYKAQANGDKATLTEVTGIIPAGTAVVLQKTGEGNDYVFNFDATAASQDESNNLVGVYAETAIPTTTNAYVLAQPADKNIGFYLLDATDRTIAANKAYLVVPAEASGIKAFTFDFGGTTGIENTEAVTETEEYYDLQGRRVMNPTKGIYVTKSGKKVLFTK